jgi:DsbC/DsbD-like thiol-disulfide interchange protein
MLMVSPKLLVLTAPLFAVCLGWAWPQAGAAVPPARQDVTEEHEVEPEVTLRLLADTSALVPGGEFFLAAYFELPEHWHIYWENAGASGMPTFVQVTGPEGFELGAPLYPGPESRELTLEAKSYVYEGEVAIFIPVKAPAELDTESALEFQLEAQWLVCKTECFLQEGSRSLKLEVHQGDEAPAAANALLLDPQRERLPLPQSELEGLRWRWMASPPEYRALIVVAGALDLEFYPSLESNLIISALARNPGSNAYEMAVDFTMTAGQEEDSPHAVGLLRVKGRERTRYYHVNFSGAAK